MAWDIVDPNNPDNRQTRVYSRGFSTEIEWSTQFSLPNFFQGRWNLTPSIQVLNQSSGPFAIRNELTGGEYVVQSKRLAYALSMSPTFYGLFPGFGPVSRFRHTISPGLSYTYAPAGHASDAYLAARNQARAGNLSDIQQQRLTLTFNHNLEAKLRRPDGDTSEAAARKIKVFSMGFSSLSYNFERAKQTGKASSGFETSNFSYTLSSDLLPGFEMGSQYSLFEGDIASDTARFKPYRLSTDMSLSIGRDRNPFAFLARIFGKAVPQSEVDQSRSAGGHARGSSSTRAAEHVWRGARSTRHRHGAGMDGVVELLVLPPASAERRRGDLLRSVRPVPNDRGPGNSGGVRAAGAAGAA